MKAKTARRFLARNKWKITRAKLDNGKFSGFTRSCLKVLRNDMRETKSVASIRAHNNFIYR